MAYPADKYVSPEEYLEREKSADNKHEYYDGQIIAMAGATENHNRIVANLIGELHKFLKGKNCDVFPSDLRVTTPFFSSFMYPDVSIVCGEVEKQDDQFDTITNPAVIIEVMSPSTKERDLGFKFWYYLQIPSLKEYILVDTATYTVKTIIKQSDNSFTVFNTEGIKASLNINAIGMELSLADIYYKVSFS
jgi:Uma2 family endonuclease